MMENIKADLDRYFKNNSRSLNLSVKKKIRLILETYGIHAIFVYRFGYWIESEIIDKNKKKVQMILHFKEKYFALN